MASWCQYIDYLIYFCLLFFIIPIKINGPTELQVQFNDYLRKFNKTYDDPELYQRKFQAFEKSLVAIAILNSQRINGSAQYGLTKFSDMLPEEFLQFQLQSNLSQRISRRHPVTSTRISRSVDALPKFIDWRQKDAITSVRNQGSCGACWAFSVVETIESMHAIKTGKLEKLSVQEMIDCAGYNNDGCDGGDICNLLWWVKDYNVSVHQESHYPLSVKKKSPCRTNSTLPGVHIKDFACENFIDMEDVMMKLLALNGPLAVAINAQTWQNYIGGIIHYHCSPDPLLLNHAVQIVGYNLDAPIPYYIVRNSWGEDFGDKGYLYIAAGENMCGIAYEVSALTVL